VRGKAVAAVSNRGLITFSIMLANIMQGVDNTILNVALPHIQVRFPPRSIRSPGTAASLTFLAL
jgi:hypothetical protein